MKRKIISSLLAITTLWGCGDGRSSSSTYEDTNPPTEPPIVEPPIVEPPVEPPIEPPEPPPPIEPTELVYTDPEAIYDRFIINEGTGQIYVHGALEQDPNGNVSSSFRNTKFRGRLENNLRATEVITNIYVSHNTSLARSNSITVPTLRAMEEISNMYSSPTRVWIDEGHYVGDGLPIILFNPIQIEGVSKNATSIGGAILALDYLGVKDLTTYGETIDFFGEEEKVGILFNAGGEFYDSIATELSVCGVNADREFTMNNVLFYNIDNPTHDGAFHFQADVTGGSLARDVNTNTRISYTTFQNLPIAFYINRRIDASNLNDINGGNNTFRDVDTAIYHSIDNTEDSFAEGNYWAESFDEE